MSREPKPPAPTGQGTGDVAAPAPVLDHAEAKDMKNQSNAQYKASKKEADARLSGSAGDGRGVAH